MQGGWCSSSLEQVRACDLQAVHAHFLQDRKQPRLSWHSTYTRQKSCSLPPPYLLPGTMPTAFPLAPSALVPSMSVKEASTTLGHCSLRAVTLTSHQSLLSCTQFHITPKSLQRRASSFQATAAEHAEHVPKNIWIRSCYQLHSTSDEQVHTKSPSSATRALAQPLQERRLESRLP